MDGDVLQMKDGIGLRTPRNEDKMACLVQRLLSIYMDDEAVFDFPIISYFTYSGFGV